MRKEIDTYHPCDDVVVRDGLVRILDLEKFVKHVLLSVRILCLFSQGHSQNELLCSKFSSWAKRGRPNGIDGIPIKQIIENRNAANQ